MLGKLFKHEWKATSRMGLLMLAALAIVTLLGVLGFAMPFSNVIGETTVYGTDEDSWGMIISMIIAMATMMIYILTLMGVVYGMLIYMGVHFYKTLYSDEGYLTHTLPVTPRQLIISKVLNGGIWYALITVGMSVSVIILGTAMLISTGEVIGFSEELGVVWQEFQEVIKSEMGAEVIHVMISLVLVLAVAPFSSMMTLMGALTIGQLASKYRALMGILAYFGISMLNGVISYIISMIVSFSSMAIADATNSSISIAVTYDASLVTSLIMLVVFYFVTHGILSKKLNME